jgi:hypothetical protein
MILFLILPSTLPHLALRDRDAQNMERAQKFDILVEDLSGLLG